MATTKRSIGVTVVLAVLVFFSQPALAQEAEVVAQGLNGPQDVIVDDDGALWVIDGGVGGDEPLQIFDGASGGVIDSGLGNSSRVVKVGTADGAVVEVASLPSYTSGDGATGGGGLALHDGVLYASVGEWVAASPSDRPAFVGTVVSVSDAGLLEVVADTFAHELQNDPYPLGGAPTSHPYGMTTGPDGSLLVADAGANALLSVDTDSGEISTVAVFEALPGAFPHPGYDGEMLTDPVPTAIVHSADGGLYVSLLSGAPFIPGNAKVVAIGADGTPQDYATGLTMLTDLAEGPDGNLYATQFAIFGENGPDPVSGAVIRIDGDGVSSTVVEGLSFPTAIDFASNGDAYVAVGGAGPPGSGQIVKIGGLADEVLPQQLARTGVSTQVAVLVGVTMLAGGIIVARSTVVRRSDLIVD